MTNALPSGELSNMRAALMSSQRSPSHLKALLRNITVDLQGSTDPTSRAVGQRAQTFIDQERHQDAQRVVLNHLWGVNTGGRRGTIRRKGYTRKSGVHVKSALIADVGHPGKGVMGTGKPGIGKLKEGELKALGYSTTAKASSRHRALTKAMKRYGPLSTYRKLNAVAVYTKRTSPASSKVFLDDRNWVGKRAGYKH